MHTAHKQQNRTIINGSSTKEGAHKPNWAQPTIQPRLIAMTTPQEDAKKYSHGYGAAGNHAPGNPGDTRPPCSPISAVSVKITTPEELTRVTLQTNVCCTNPPKHKQRSNHNTAPLDKALCQGQRPNVRNPERQGFARVHVTIKVKNCVLKTHERITNRLKLVDKARINSEIRLR